MSTDAALDALLHAAELGDDESVRRHLASDPSLAAAKGGARGWDALTTLCFSKHLRDDRARAPSFLRAARLLLDAGAPANTGWFEQMHQPEPVFESALYAAAGIARDADLTRLLLECGADPNDDETAYHAAETYDNAAVRALLESGRLTPDSLAVLLVRKADWHDLDGMRLVLDAGGDPNRVTRWGRRTALHHAILRDNRIEIIRLLLDSGADPAAVSATGTAVAIAASRGRRDILIELIRRDVALDVHGVDRVLAACAMDDRDMLRQMATTDPEAIASVRRNGGDALGGFAGTGNLAGVAHLLDLGVPVDAPAPRHDGYWGLAERSTALHVAAWRAQHETVRLLIERGADVNAKAADGRTPLMLAVKACMESYWMDLRSAASVAALLHAGASKTGITVPTGYDEIDAMLS